MRIGFGTLAVNDAIISAVSASNGDETATEVKVAVTVTGVRPVGYDTLITVERSVDAILDYAERIALDAVSGPRAVGEIDIPRFSDCGRT
jgi:hypothetical protein